MKKILNLAIYLLFIIGLIPTLLLSEDTENGKLTADIDSDGRLEMILWRKFGTTELGDYYRLWVIDDDGKILWKGPKEKDEGNPYVFSSLDIGVSLPQLLADIDNDGYVELLAPELQSDVRPTYYRKLRWKGTYFEQLPSYALMMKSATSDQLVWKKTNDLYVVWVSRIDYKSAYKNGLVKVNIMEMINDSTVRTGVALIRFVPQGAIIKRWLEPLQSDDERSTAKNNYSVSTPAISRTGNSTYRARLSYHDHHNSRGKRLVKIKDVLRQDRANLYKQGGDPEDQRDPYFYTGEGRNTMEWIKMHSVGRSYASMKEIIVNETPLVEVDVRQNGLHIKILKR